MGVTSEPNVGNDETFSWPADWEKAIPAVTTMVFSFCRRRGVAEADIDDLLQCVLMRLLIEATANKRHFLSLAPLCVWFRKFLASQFTKQVRRQSREEATEGLNPASDSGEPGDEDMAFYLSLLDDSPERDVLFLYYVENLKLKAIGKRLGFSTTQAHNLLEKAYKKLLRRLSP